MPLLCFIYEGTGVCGTGFNPGVLIGTSDPLISFHTIWIVMGEHLRQWGLFPGFFDIKIIKYLRKGDSVFVKGKDLNSIINTELNKKGISILQDKNAKYTLSYYYGMDKRTKRSILQLRIENNDTKEIYSSASYNLGLKLPKAYIVSFLNKAIRN